MKIAENDRDMLEYLSEACESQVYVCDQCGHEEALSTFDIASDLRDYMATEQQQSEPVAWIEVADLKEIAKGARWSGTVWGRPADDKGLYRLPPRVPVYTHADPGEVQRLIAQLGERDALLQSAARALEAADALEREAFKKGAANVGAGMFRGMRVLLDQHAALSASAPKELKAPCNHIFAARGHLFVCVHCEVLTDCPLCVGKRTVPSAEAGYVKDCPACCGEEG